MQYKQTTQLPQKLMSVVLTTVTTTLAVSGAVTGGASNHIANIAKMSKIDIENLSFVLGILGSAETAMVTTWNKLNSLKGEEDGIQQC